MILLGEFRPDCLFMAEWIYLIRLCKYGRFKDFFVNYVAVLLFSVIEQFMLITNAC